MSVVDTICARARARGCVIVICINCMRIGWRGAQLYSGGCQQVVCDAMIVVRNATKVGKVDAAWMRTTLRAVVAAAGYSGWDVGVKNVSPSAIARLNARYRGKAAPTDILSFANYTLAAPEAFVAGDVAELGKDLGDLVVCGEYVAQHIARAHVPDAAAHWRMLLTHGVVHLLGYDHETEEQHAAMAAREAAVMARLLA